MHRWSIKIGSKKLLIGLAVIVLTCLSCSVGMADSEIHLYDYDDALSEASNNNKYVLLYFWSENCPYCRMMQTKVLPEKNVTETINKSFAMVSLNTENNGLKLAKTYRIRSVPTFIFLDSQGEMATILPGAVEADIFIMVLNYVSSGSYKTMEFDEYADSL